MKFAVDDIFPAWVNRTAHIFRTVFTERASVHGLNWAEGVILLKLSMGHNTLVDLSRHLEHSHPAILRHVDKLENLGMVARTAHPDDRRIKILVLTERGKSTALALQEMARNFSQELAERFGKERIAAASELMRDIVSAHTDKDFVGCPATEISIADRKKGEHEA